MRRYLGVKISERPHLGTKVLKIDKANSKARRMALIQEHKAPRACEEVVCKVRDSYQVSLFYV